MIDGVIKYTINHTTKTTSEFHNFKELEALRSRLFTLGLIGVQDGIGYGNISSRENNSFFITATQTGEMSNLTANYYTNIISYDFSNFSVTSQGEHQPSSEALSHAMIYEIHPEINSVIHVHSKALWEFMKKDSSLYTEAEYGTVQMVEEIASLYRDKNPFDNSIFVMRGHEDGIIAFGKSVKEAELKLYTKIQEYLSIV
jgi:ribulose-5-phosphate 4-epimerase/fuculose-1-phosphate aldolase